ncbi:MAG: antibiotic biosynthesis monooxygenase [Leptolyngbya sp. SIO3F4]|nr:antibiotic biosynthesis monooxygenase [Leptolyngbya sp. SIO3F4]
MGTPLTIVGKIEANPDKIEFVKAELLKLIPITLKEVGCIQYDLHQDNDNPAVFLFYENWESRELWQQHMSNTHLVAYLKATEGSVASFTLNEMTKC